MPHNYEYIENVSIFFFLIYFITEVNLFDKHVINVIVTIHHQADRYERMFENILKFTYNDYNIRISVHELS